MNCIPSNLLRNCVRFFVFINIFLTYFCQHPSPLLPETVALIKSSQFTAADLAVKHSKYISIKVVRGHSRSFLPSFDVFGIIAWLELPAVSKHQTVYMFI